MGKIELKKWGIAEQKAVHEAIIDESTFRKVQIMLEKKGKKKHSNLSPEEFPLKGDLSQITPNLDKWHAPVGCHGRIGWRRCQGGHGRTGGRRCQGGHGGRRPQVQG